MKSIPVLTTPLLLLTAIVLAPLRSIRSMGTAKFGQIVIVGLFAIGFSVVFSAITYAVLGYLSGPSNPMTFLIFVLLFFALIFAAGWTILYITRRFGKGVAV